MGTVSYIILIAGYHLHIYKLTPHLMVFINLALCSPEAIPWMINSHRSHWAIEVVEGDQRQDLYYKHVFWLSRKTSFSSCPFRSITEWGGEVRRVRPVDSQVYDSQSKVAGRNWSGKLLSALLHWLSFLVKREHALPLQCFPSDIYSPLRVTGNDMAALYRQI